MAGCYPEPTFDGEPCSSSTECERGKGCRVSEGVCVDVPDNALMGTFRCAVTDDVMAPGTVGGSDVTGFVDEIEFSLISGTACLLYPDGSLGFDLLGLRFRLTAVVTESGPGRHELPPFDAVRQTGAMLGPPLEGGVVLPLSGYVTGGFYELAERARLGDELEIYLEAFLELPADEERVGVPCENGQPACGAYPFSRTYCATFLNPVCTADCRDASDCEAFGGDTCDDELCYKSCSTSADCEAPLECLTLTNGVSICV
ncbi:MAG TPA: hypothetical protein VFZ53_32660 [Polyangiaceae bacterium]